MEQWEWEPLNRDELWQYFPDKLKHGGPTELHVPQFLAPPRPPYELIGRNDLLSQLKQQLLIGGSFALSALRGLPGVGKTALAIELAHDHDILEHFRDGVLWARLGREARETDVVRELGKWGMALGIPADKINKLSVYP